MIEQYGREYGQSAVDALPFELHWIYWETQDAKNERLHLLKGKQREEFVQGQERAGKILAAFYPEYDPLRPGFINAASMSEQLELFRALEPLKSRKIDEAIFAHFQSTAGKKTPSDRERVELDNAACACMSYLLGKGHEAEFRAFVEKRLREIEVLPEGSKGRESLDLLRSWDRRLKK
jgi:hypothetical protein